ncbi:redoxin family protein [Olivibacter sp. CPCC 100613]|uniref:redoxin family protein n=1 Tax=Olivibacter sp. CPCC 100613 TaxID=3079931 RepID=UPI002FF5F862
MQQLKYSYSLFSIFVLVLLSSFISRSAREERNGLKIGDQAPDFTLPGIDGKQYSLENFKKSPILMLVFTCNHCPTAQAYEDRIINLTATYRDKGVAVVAISPNNPQSVRLDELGYTEYNDSPEEMKARAADKSFNFPYLYDGEKQSTSKQYGAVATPHVFIFDSDRKLRYKGRFDDNENPKETKEHNAIQAIEALLAKKDIAVKETKTFGCSVKWLSKEDGVKKSDEQWAKEPIAINTIQVAQIDSLLQNNSDKLRLINVWATWCGPCVAEFPDFVIINRMYRNRSFEFISISADHPEKPKPVLDFLKSKGAANKNFLFGSKNKYDLIEAIDKDWQGALPYTILVAPGGKILYSKQGEMNPLEMKKEILKHIGRYYF